MVPKWHLAGLLAGADVLNTRAVRDAQTKFPFSPGATLGGFSLA